MISNKIKKKWVKSRGIVLDFIVYWGGAGYIWLLCTLKNRNSTFYGVFGLMGRKESMRKREQEYVQNNFASKFSTWEYCSLCPPNPVIYYSQAFL